jgi:hypothetical protein
MLLPVPFDLPGLIQVASVDVVQLHVLAAVSVNEPLPPGWGIDVLAGDTVPVHDEAFDWLTVTDWPATVTTSVRGLVVALAVAVRVTLPSPVPLAGDTVIHEAVVEAVQLQPAAAVTVTDALPPLPGVLTVVGVTVKLQPAPAWSTTTGLVATVTVARRAVADVFGATVRTTEPDAIELEGETVTHVSLDAAVQVQPAGAATPTDAVPPSAGSEMLVADTE